MSHFKAKMHQIRFGSLLLSAHRAKDLSVNAMSHICTAQPLRTAAVATCVYNPRKPDVVSFARFMGWHCFLYDIDGRLYSSKTLVQRNNYRIYRHYRHRNKRLLTTKMRLSHTDNEAGLSSPRHWPTSCLSASTADGRTVNDVMSHYSPSTRTANNVWRMPAHRARAHGG